MTQSTPLYYLSQALELRDTLSAVERTLQIDSTERSWLSNLFLASQSAREALDTPMFVDKLFIVAASASTADLAGTFLIRGPARHPVYLCSPGFGLERFESSQQALEHVRARLRITAHRDELLRFVPLKIRNTLGVEPPPGLVTRPIQGVVLSDRRQSVQAYLDSTLNDLRDELLQLPSLTVLLKQLLENTLGARFPQVRLQALRVISHDTSTGLPLRQVSIQTLGETLLEHYNRGGWPSGQSREFIAPDYSAQPAEITLWESTLATLANQLQAHLQNRLKAFWDTPLSSGEPRRQLFIDALGSRFRAELLKQELDWNAIAADDYQWLCGLYPLDRSRLESVTLHTLSVQVANESFSLGNAFVVRHDRSGYADHFLYGGEWLQTFESEQALLDSVKTQLEVPSREHDLRLGLSLRERGELNNTGIDRVTLTASEASIFEALFNLGIAKQLDNVRYVLERYRRSNAALALSSAFESALDIRDLLSPRLAEMAPLARWSHRLDLTASEKPGAPGLTNTLKPSLETARHQLATLERLGTQLSTGFKQRPTLSEFIRGELSSALQGAQVGNLSPDNLYINHYAAALPRFGISNLEPVTSQSVVAHVLERLGGHSGALASVSSSGLFSKDAGGLWARVPNLDIDQLNVIVERLLPDFLGHYLRRHRSIYGSFSTSLNEAITSGLRREAQLKEVRGALGVDDLALLDNLLDGHPRAERQGLRGFIPDAFELTYQRDSTTAPSKLHNCFLLTARGGLNSEHCGATLLWTPAQGAEPFETFHDAEVELQRRLHHPVERLSLLENLANDQRPAHPPITPAPRGNHRVYPSLGFKLIHSSLLSNRFNSLTDKALADLNHAATSGYTGKQFQQNLQSCLDSHSTVPMLERAIQAAQNTATHLALPSWLGSVSDSRQFALAALLDRYRQAAATTDDYHLGIPQLRDTARTKLRSLLSRDFPDQRLDPDQIRVWLTPSDSALPVHEALTDFALRHFDDIGQRSIEVSLVLGTLPAALTGDRIKALVQEAAIGNHYAVLLASHLAPDEPHNAHRRPMFSRHGYWQGLLHAFTQLLGKTLSRTAHGFIKHLLAMPDGVARLPLNGQHIELRPLQLLSGLQSAADAVRGFYLIGPDAGGQGPSILFSPQGERPMFQEYANDAACLSAIRTSPSLQQQLLERLAPERHGHYTQLFTASSTALKIGGSPLRGNLFHRLYEDMTELFKDMLGRQSVQGQGSVWSKALDWLKGELYQGATHLLGRLRLPWLVWQSLSQLKDATQHAWQGRWSEAIEEFVIALANLATARRGWSHSNLGGVTRTTAERFIESPFPAPPWNGHGLVPRQKNRLLALQAHRIELEQTRPNPAGDLYTDPSTGDTFVAVGGTVFQVRQEQQRWRIVTDTGKGPRLRQDNQGRWVFDLPAQCREERHDENA